MGILLTVLVVVFAIPAWVSVVQGHKVWRTVWQPLIALSVSEALQLVFVNGVARGIFRLEHSLRFAAIGVPCSIVALVLCTRYKFASRARIGIVATAWLTLGMWFLLITLH